MLKDMNPWLDFIITVLVRLLCGAVLGAVAAFIITFRSTMREISQSHFPIERVLIFALIGGVICTFTTPRDSRPWVK